MYKPKQAVTDRKHVDMNDKGGSMDNVQVTDQFIKEYDDKLHALVADLGLEDVYICIDGTAPTDPEKLSKCYTISEPEPGHAILFNWKRVLDGADFRFGLLIFAYWLRRIWQGEKLGLTDEIKSGTTSPDAKKYDNDALYYAYESVQRLFKLYRRGEGMPRLSVKDPSETADQKGDKNNSTGGCNE